jgi:hypothetical protein
MHCRPPKSVGTRLYRDTVQQKPFFVTAAVANCEAASFPQCEVNC